MFCLLPDPEELSKNIQEKQGGIPLVACRGEDTAGQELQGITDTFMEAGEGAEGVRMWYGSSREMVQKCRDLCMIQGIFSKKGGGGVGGDPLFFVCYWGVPNSPRTNRAVCETQGRTRDYRDKGTPSLQAERGQALIR